jgi:hypothetical protein
MKSKKPTRASPRIAKRHLTAYASWLPIRKQKEVSKLLAKNQIWPATRCMYNKSNTSSRIGISPCFFPAPPKYNVTKNRIVSTRPTSNKRTVNRAIQKSINNKSIVNIVVPLTGNTTKKRGGVNPEYVQNAVRNANIRYATVGNNGKLKAFAFIKTTSPNSRYINVIGAYQGYGHSLMNKIINNARINRLRKINLKAVTHVTKNSNANNDPLVKWYKGKGFVRSGQLNNEQLLPMSIRL